MNSFWKMLSRAFAEIVLAIKEVIYFKYLCVRRGVSVGGGLTIERKIMLSRNSSLVYPTQQKL